MALDDKLWIWAYSMDSDSAKLLAEKADVWIIKHRGSNFHGKKGQFILNWGGGTGNYEADTGKATLLNPPDLIDDAINKISYFNAVNRPNGPRVPRWTTSMKTAKSWLDDGEQVIARDTVTGCKGAGITVMKNPLDFVRAPLYTIRVDNVAEYRVYMFKDEVIDWRIKKGEFTDGMCVGEGVEFLIDDNPLPDDVVTQAKKAAKALKLTTQGLDIIWDGKKAYVLETNTAPYLGIQVAKKYAKRLEKFVEEAA